MEKENSYTNDYLLDRQVKILQPVDGYRASTDAVFLSSLVDGKKIKENAAVLDVGSGTGAVSSRLAARLSEKKLKITGLDIQADLVKLSNQSSEANGFADFLHYEYADIRNGVSLVPGSFDVVITNPPYSDHDMPSPNTGKQLAHNLQNFSLFEWLVFCLKMLKPKGEVFVINRAEAVNEILAALHNRAGEVRLLPIYSKSGREAKRIAVIAKKGTRGITRILPPFYVHNEDGSYAETAEKILRKGCGYFD